jgi:SH3-like domain-containing protein
MTRRILARALVPLLAVLGTPEASPAQKRGSVSGVNIPRFAALRADVVNLRRGPGERYPIDWVYHRAGLPIEITREFGPWRQVRMYDGTTGWMFHSLLTSRRGFIVTVAEATIRRRPEPAARAVAHLSHGVVGRLRHCEAASAWCQVSVGHHTGYLRRAAFWGSYPGEAVAE